MTVNISALETIIQSKMNALTAGSDSKEVIYLAKALEALDSGVLTTYALYSSLPAAADSTGRVVYVADTSKVYYSNGSTWVVLSISTIYSIFSKICFLLFSSFSYPLTYFNPSINLI